MDGLRGIGVVYVLLYHAGVAHVPGAILTMDMFFALSGFLITSLLVAEWQRTGRIRLKSFWVRRARRLAPALVLALLGVAAYIHFVADAADRASLRADALSTLGYTANWRFVFEGKSYFDQFAQPSPLLHTWSLSVEEQFYLFWPLVAIALCALARRRRELWLTLAALAGALGSALLMALLARRGVDPSRLYYGTDTRAQCLLVGAVLGAAQIAPRWRVPTVVRRLLPLLGVVALGLLITSWHVVDTRSSWLYQGGFLAVVVITMVIVAAVTESPDGVLARVLSVRLVLYLGQISYGLYLYHWPIFLWLTHARTGLSGPALLAARLGVTFAAAVVSYHLVENPIRTGTFRLPRPRFTVAATATCVAGVVVVAASGGGSASSAISGYDEATGQVNGGAPHPPPPAVGASGGARPVRVLLVGDSLALTLGNAMSPLAGSYGVSLYNAGTVGCGIARGGPVIYNGVPHDLLPRCQQWPVTRAQEVAGFAPDVSVQLVGRWDILDRVHDGRWMHIGEPDFDAYLRTELDRSVSVLGARGAKVVFLTAPCFQGRERLDGRPWPEDDQARVDAFNTLVRQVGEAHRGQVSVIDFLPLVCPGGHFARSMNGQVIRSDGIHVDPAVGPMVAGSLLPQIAGLGAARRDAEPPEPASAAGQDARHANEGTTRRPQITDFAAQQPTR
ncbi:MAG: acyltransferase family protein [Frankiaceae bacterium]